MKILIDTREQLPLEFEHRYISETVRTTLEVGDYGCQFEDGFEPPIYFERKTVPDLFGTLSAGYTRFKKEINRAADQHKVLIIIIEGTLSKVLDGYERSQRTGDEITSQLFTLLVRHKLPFVCCKDREEMSRYITELFLAVGREYVRCKKEKAVV